MADTFFPYQLAASDLDDTLLDPHKQISPANAQAVRDLQAHGARFVLASGRRHQNSIRFYRELHLDGLLISSSGAWVQDPAGGPVIHAAPLPPALAQELVTRGQDEGHSVIYYHRDALYIGRRDRWIELYESRAGEQATLLPGGDLRALGGDACLKIVWYGDPQRLRDERPDLTQTYQNRAIVLSTATENLEFMAPDANKAAALAAVANFYGVPQPATIALGDGENDAPMLRWAGLGVAVSNALAQTKQAADLVGPPGSLEDAFARAVQAIFDHVRQAPTPAPAHA